LRLGTTSNFVIRMRIRLQQRSSIWKLGR